MAEKRYENKEMQRHYENTRAKGSGEKKSVGSRDREQSEHEEESPIEDVVAEHGPAEHMEISSHHEDGHVHKMTHHDAESAHHHVAGAFQEEPAEEADKNGPSPQPTAPGPGGAPAIPTMA
jgi:hypothetical protein